MRLRWVLLSAAALLFSAMPVTVIVSAGPASAGTETQFTPVDPQAAPATAAELNYLGNLPGTGRFLTGYFAGWSNTGSSSPLSGYQDIADLFHATGEYPGLVECDYNGFGNPSSPTYVDSGSCDSYLEGYWGRGGVVEVGFHPNNPVQGGGYATGLTAAQVTELRTSGTAAYANWQQQLTAVATALNQLGAAGVTVIFRPLMEMNETGSGWFWWNGSGWTGNDYAAVWQQMYATITSKLTYHNVLWDWSPDQDGADPAAYYPGAAYVDITGLDVYALSASGYPTESISNYAKVLEPGKPFGFNEIGMQGSFSYDFSRWPAAIASTYPKASFFLSWNGSNGLLGTNGSYQNTGGRALMNASQDVNLTGSHLIAGFEGGSTGGWGDWTSQSGAMSSAWSVSDADGTDRASQGQYALKANITSLNPGQQAIFNDYGFYQDLAGKTELSATVNVASWNQPATGMTAQLYVRTGSSATWYSGPVVPVTNSAAGTTLTMSLSGIPNLDDVTEIGVVFVPTTTAASGALYVDNVTIQ